MNLFYRHFGNGEPIIILHGLFGQSDNWVTMGKRLAENFSVFLPDQRNHGQSPHTPVHTYPALSDDLQEFLEQQGMQKVTLIGHSMGGKVAMTFAFEHPEMVKNLAVVDISPRKYQERSVHTQVISEMLSLDLDSLKTRSKVEEILESRVADSRLRFFILKNLYYKQPGKLGWRLNLDSLFGNLDNLFDGVNINTAYYGPCLFIRGAESDYISDEDIPLISSLFPNSSIKTISGASHWVHADAPDDLYRALIEFLRPDSEI